MKVLLLGGTGRTGGRVLQQLLGRGVPVRAVVRSAERLPEGVADDPNLTVVVAELTNLSDEPVREQVDRVYRAARELRPAQPVKLILMSSVSVNRPGGLDARRGRFERATLWAQRGLVPPGRDNQRAADFLHEVIEAADPYAQWVTVRPDSLKEGDVTEYTLHEGLVNGLFHPGETSMANVAHFMCELATDPDVWAAWRGKLPVIVNAPSR
jgi:uncharacterized protein YbjT (DUF2867 family)